MPKIFAKIKSFFEIIFKWKRFVTLRNLEKDLKKAIINDKADKIIYISIINKDMRKALRIDANSDYIPDDIKNREEVRTILLARHGENMKKLNIQLTEDLRLI